LADDVGPFGIIYLFGIERDEIIGNFDVAHNGCFEKQRIA
jgi:hypothetical protein